MTKVYKFLKGHVDFQASDVGLHVAASSTRGAGVHLMQRRARNCVSAGLFPLRAATAWKKVSISILCSQIVKIFRRTLYKHILQRQITN